MTKSKERKEIPIFDLLLIWRTWLVWLEEFFLSLTRGDQEHMPNMNMGSINIYPHTHIDGYGFNF